MARANWKETEATVFTCGVTNHAEPGKVYIPGTGYSDYLITFSYDGTAASSTPAHRASEARSSLCAMTLDILRIMTCRSLIDRTFGQTL
jgi:hypothetical protein